MTIESESLQEYHALYDHIVSRLIPDRMNYIFLDEIQMVDQFQKAVNSLFLRENVGIYLTGANAKMLSGELTTLLSGRYVEISMLPLSFREFYEIVGGDKRTAFTTYTERAVSPIRLRSMHQSHTESICLPVKTEPSR